MNDLFLQFLPASTWALLLPIFTCALLLYAIESLDGRRTESNQLRRRSSVRKDLSKLTSSVIVVMEDEEGEEEWRKYFFFFLYLNNFPGVLGLNKLGPSKTGKLSFH